MLRGAVVQPQLARTPADVDAAAAQHHAPAAVDALVAVAGDEKAVLALRRDGAKQAERCRAHVLRFVHDHSAVVAEIPRRRRLGGEQRRGVAVGVVELLHAPLRQLRPVLREHRPDERPLGARQARAAASAGHAQIGLLVRHVGGLDHLFPLVLEEGVRQIQRWRLGVQGDPPRFPVAAELRAELVAAHLQKTHHPAIQIGHFDALHLLRRADGAEVVLDIRGQVAREGGEQNAAFGEVPNQPASAMHRHHRLAGAGAAEQTHRPVPIPLHHAPLRRVQEHAPALQRRVQHGFEFHFVRGNGESHLRLGAFEGRVEIAGVHNVRRFPLAHQLFVGIAGQIKEQRVVGFGGKALLEGFERVFIRHAAHFRQHRLRHAEAHQLPILQCGERAGRLGGRFWRCGRRIALRQVDLHGARGRIDVAPTARGPVVRIVVLVRPQQQMNAAALRLGDDGAVADVDAQRAHVGIRRALDALVVQAARGGVGVEAADEVAHATLLSARQLRERGEKLHMHGHVVGHGGLASR